jgi:[ribosomal protein S18]-alanine N-acetyltransferase
VVAFLCLRNTGPDELEVLNVAVDPAWRSQGIGTRLLEFSLETSSKTVHLEVRESNLAAISCYRGLGFYVAGRRPGYYQNPDESGIVMTLRK